MSINDGYYIRCPKCGSYIARDKEFRERLIKIESDALYYKFVYDDFQKLILDLIGEDEASNNPALRYGKVRMVYRNELREELGKIVKGDNIRIIKLGS
jgi:hypothetical protein